GLLITWLLRPIPAIAEGLARIGRGDLDSPMEIKDPTELGVLARSINDMAAQLKSSQSQIHDRELEIVATQKEIIHTLGDVVESRSSETANHTRRVAAMSMKLAELAGVPTKEANLLRMASPMHDVGKIGIPDSILNKPGKLTTEEFEIMKTHAEIGYRILAKSERMILKAAAIIAHEHHERWDGKGYPQGLAGEDIHIFGRIVSLVDVFDAVYSDRVYRPAMKLDKVLEIIHNGRGVNFQPKLVDLFLGNLDTFLAIHRQFDDMDRYVKVLSPMETEMEPVEETVHS
ncbi:MAG: HD domain-containing protein, partial [Gemmatimonadales bacterium]|nr:HD domain-containing protein [Gemmatimonadales bacterium]